MKKKMTLNYVKNYLLIFSLIILISSCGSKQEIVYFQGVNQNNNSISIKQYNPTFKPDDMLTITVSAIDQDAVRPFNLPTISFGSNGQTLGSQVQQTYLVDSNGNIEFPVLGTLKVSGLTRIEATEMIKKLLTTYVKNPIVNIRNVNFKVTVLGEVARPGVYTIQNDRITLLEAIGLAGDLNLQAVRSNIKVIREINGKKTHHLIDLTSDDVFNSPVYYLSQNDVIYVQPNNSRIKSSSVGPNTSATFSLISALATVTALIVTITRN